MHGRNIASLAMLLGIAANASGSILFSTTIVDNSAYLTDYTTYDLKVISDTDWTGAVFLLEVTSGAIYQNPYGTSNSVPNPYLISLIPELEFDTYMIGNVAGGAGDVGGDSFEFDEAELDISWYNNSSNDIGTTTIGRLTISNDAVWDWALALTAEDQAVLKQSGTVGQTAQASSGEGIVGLGGSSLELPMINELTGIHALRARLGKPYATSYATYVQLKDEQPQLKAFGTPDETSLPEPTSFTLCGVLAGILMSRRAN